MSSIPMSNPPLNPPHALEPAGVHGVPWSTILRLRNGMAASWCRRFRRLIPVEEFRSAGNLAIVQAIHSYDPAREIPFRRYVAKILRYRMYSVVRDEWRPWTTYTLSDERDHRRRRKVLRRNFHAPRLDPLPAEEIDDATDDWPTPVPPSLRTEVSYVDSVYLQQGLTFLERHVQGKRQNYMREALQEEGTPAIAARHGVTMQTVQNALKRTRQRVQRWAAGGAHWEDVNAPLHPS